MCVPNDPSDEESDSLSSSASQNSPLLSSSSLNTSPAKLFLSKPLPTPSRLKVKSCGANVTLALTGSNSNTSLGLSSNSIPSETRRIGVIPLIGGARFCWLGGMTLPESLLTKNDFRGRIASGSLPDESWLYVVF